MFKHEDRDSKFKHAYIYGNVIELVFEDLTVDEVFENQIFSNFFSVDNSVKGLFTEQTGKALFQIYLGKEVLNDNELSFPNLFIISTVYFTVLVAENEVEFQQISERMKKITIILSGTILIGKDSVTNFIHDPFSRKIITVNPIIMRDPKDMKFFTLSSEKTPSTKEELNRHKT